jgi:hypothetical protein
VSPAFPIPFIFIVTGQSACLLCHPAAKNPGHGLNTPSDANRDCGKPKQGFFDPVFDLDLKLFGQDRHIMRCFNPTLDPIHLPMNGLNDAFDIPRNSGDVTTDGSHLEVYGIDQFFCFSSGPANPEKDRDEEDEDQNHDRRNDGNTDGQ